MSGLYPFCLAVERGWLKCLDDNVHVELDQLILARIGTFQGVVQQEKSYAGEAEE